jgi:Tol biopolymer transport system component
MNKYLKATLSVFALSTLSLALSPQIKAADPQTPTSTPIQPQGDFKNPFISNTRQLTFVGPRAGEGYFSADGNLMIFQSERTAENPFYQMYVMNLKTGTTKRLSPGYGQTTCGWIHPKMKKAIWSSTHLDPKWKKIQEAEQAERKKPVQKRYSWSFDPAYEIFESDLQGKNLKRLTKSPGYDAESSYSPDGRWIAFASNRTGYTEQLPENEKMLFEKDASSQMEIYIMKADGSHVRRLTRALGYDGGPFFSHDGKQITWRRFSPDGASAEIWTMNVDGSEQKQITHLNKLSWAPFYHTSGDYIIFASNIEGHANFELYIVDAKGLKEPVRVTFEPGFDGLGTFSPDGTELTWTHRNEKGESQIYVGEWNDEAARKALGLAPSQPSLLSLSSEIKISDLKALVQYLASPEMEGRSTGSAQEKIYTGQIASLFKTWGLVPAPGFTDYFQEFDFISGVKFGEQNKLAFVTNNEKLRTDDSLNKLTLSQSFEPLSLSKSGKFSAAPIVFAGYGLKTPVTDKVPAYNSYDNLDVKDKWVLVLQDVPQDVKPEIRYYYNQFSRVEFKATVAKSEGALGLLVATGPLTPMIEKWGKPRIEGGPQESGIPVIKINSEVLEKLMAQEGFNIKDLQKDWDTLKTKKGFEFKNLKAEAEVDLSFEHSHGRNVVGVLKAPALKNATALILGAHGDHLGRGATGNSLARSNELNQIHFGADDNASGVSVVLELAHSFSAAKNKKDFKKDLYFAVWSGEEIGLLGSQAWAKEWAAHNGNLSKTFAANLNFDMVGRLREKLIVQSVGSSPVWAPLFEELSIRTGMPMSLVEDPFLPTDSTTFYLEKVPSITFFTGSHADYHSPRDRSEFINYSGLQKIAELSQEWVKSLVTVKDKISFRDVPQGKKTMGQRSFRIFLGTIPDYSQDQIKGVRLGGVSKDSPAEKGGLKSQDVIVELAGQKIENLYDYTYVLQSLKPGDQVPVKVLRLGKSQELTITPVLKE